MNTDRDGVFSDADRKQIAANKNTGVWSFILEQLKENDLCEFKIPPLGRDRNGIASSIRSFGRANGVKLSVETRLDGSNPNFIISVSKAIDV